MNYTVERLLDDEDLAEIRRVYDETPAHEAHQDYNLFDIEKRIVYPIHLETVSKKLSDYTGYDLLGQHYFVKYTTDSFTRIHTDDESNVGKTVVTLIDQQDLVGGETFIFDKYEAKARPSTKYAKRAGDGKGPYGKDIIPTIVPMQVGESVIYNHSTRHGVCRVHSGMRLVLVSWYAKDNRT